MLFAVVTKAWRSFFPTDRIIVTGNPCRNSAVAIEGKKEEGCKEYGFDPTKKIVLIIGRKFRGKNFKR